VLLVSHMSTRLQIPKWLNDLGLTNEAVEVGTHRGEYARVFAEKWKGKLFHCVDPWYNPPEYESQAKYLSGPNNGKDRDKDYQAASIAIGNRKNVELHQATSQQALQLFPSNYLDFVYIDGDHSYQMVVYDVWNWWVKVKPGGIFAGHDIVCPGPKNEENWGRNIQPVLFDFAEKQRVDIYLIVEETNTNWSWYIHKPEGK
jgi:hypothetical protein